MVHWVGVSVCKRETEGESWVGGGVEVAGCLCPTLFPAFYHSPELVSPLRLTGETFRVSIGEVHSKQSCMESSPRCLFQQAELFCWMRPSCNPAKTTHVFIIFIYACSWQVQPLLSEWITFLLSVKCGLWQSGSGLELLYFYVFWLNIHCRVTPQHTIWEAFFVAEWMHSIPVNLWFCGWKCATKGSGVC